MFTFVKINLKTMKKLSLRQLIATALIGIFLFSSCASTTMIQSNPSDANVYINGVPVGNTPYQYRDTKIVGSTQSLRLEKEGYYPINTYFSRDEEVAVGPLVGGIFFLIPFLWIMKYTPQHYYELQPMNQLPPAAPINNFPAQNNPQAPVQPQNNNEAPKTIEQQLTELKTLYDKGLITKEDYEAKKAEILQKM